MYHAHFGMHTDPFPLSPKLVFVYQSRAFGETMAHLIYGVEQEEDIVLITGGIGTGKTLALRSLMSQLPGHLRSVMVGVTKMTFAELLKYVLLELEMPVTGPLDTAELLQHLKTALKDLHRRQGKLLLIIDEAQHLDVEVLEGLRLLINLSPPERQTLQMVLSGQPALEETIARPELVQLTQRIRVRYRLEALSREEMEAYIDHRTKVAGCAQPLFRDGALDRIYQFSRGIPRVVNILASRALLATFVAGKSRVGPEHVKQEDLPPVTDAPLTAAAASPETTSSMVPPPEPRPPEPPAPEPEPVPAAPPPPPEPVVTRPSPAPGPEPGPVLMRRRDDRKRRRDDDSRRRILWLAILLPLLVLLAVWQGPTLWRQFQSANAVGERNDSASAPERVPATDTAVAQTGDAAETSPPAGGPVEEPGVDSPGAAASTTVANQDQVSLHVASFRTVDRAQRFLGSLRDAGFPAYPAQVPVGGEVWIRVYVGPYADRTAASRAESLLRENGVIGWSHLVPVEG